METRRVNKVKSKKPIYILIAVIVFFILFISLISMPSKLNTAIDEIQVSANMNEVKSIFDKYKFDLLETDKNGNKSIAIEFQDEVRKKLSTFNLNEEEIKLISDEYKRKMNLLERKLSVIKLIDEKGFSQHLCQSW